MKRIISNEDKERVKKRNQFIVGIVLIFLMLFSTIGFAFNFRLTGNVIEEVEHNGVDFSRDPNTGYWAFNFGGNDYFSIYSPEEVSDISFVNSKSVNNYANKPVYFVGEAGDGFAEIYRVLTNYVSRVGGACLDEECEEDYPLKDCSVDNVIIIEEVLETGEAAGTVSEDTVGPVEEIVNEGNCVYIRAKPENLVRYSDAFMYDLLGLR